MGRQLAVSKVSLRQKFEDANFFVHVIALFHQWCFCMYASSKSQQGYGLQTNDWQRWDWSRVWIIRTNIRCINRLLFLIRLIIGLKYLIYKKVFMYFLKDSSALTFFQYYYSPVNSVEQDSRQVFFYFQPVMIGSFMKEENSLA